MQPFSRVCEFARVWYGRHLDPDWKKWSADEAQAIFTQIRRTDTPVSGKTIGPPRGSPLVCTS